MNWSIALLAAVVGYLSGSISFARLVTRVFAPGHDISKLEVQVPDSDVKFESDVISATTVRLHLGSRYGCLTSILDMLKAGLPALAFKLLYPGAPYYLIAASMATVGHNWPLYHGFKGGRGLSPILGGLMVVDWLGTLVTQIVGSVIGIGAKNTLIAIGAGILLMVIWVWVRSGDWAEVVYVVAMNVLFWGAMRPEVQESARLRREGMLQTFRDAENLRVVGRRGEQVIRSANLSRTWDQIKARLGRGQENAP